VPICVRIWCYGISYQSDERFIAKLYFEMAELRRPTMKDQRHSAQTISFGCDCRKTERMSMNSTERILLVEDNAGDVRLLREMLNDEHARQTELAHVGCMLEAERYLAENVVDVMVLDPGLPDAQGLGAIRRAHAAAPRVPLVVLTALDDESLAAQSLHEGAQDYLIKGQIEVRGFQRALRYAIERKRLERLKDEFVSTVSHELRTPLTSISGSLGLLMGNAAGNLPRPMARLLSIAYTNCQRLVRLVNDILDIEKMDAGRIVFNFGRVDVRRLVVQVIEASRGFAEGYGVRIRLEASRAAAEVRADPDRLAQVITNLLSNAIKFSPEDKEVVVAIEQDQDVLRLTVRDHGSGIPVDFRPLIFEKFAQADARDARQKGGTGLGLSIVKQIVDRLGGEVGFADAAGGGTIFHVQLPCWDHVARLTVDREAKADATRLLLCEDDLDTALTLREQLRQVGFATDFAYSAADALTRAAASQYHAILVDIHLPDGDGVSLILRLRALPQYHDTSIIVISGDVSHGRDDLRSSTLNVLDWLNKPVDFDRLIRALVKPVADTNRRPRILHVDDDNIVTSALSEIGDVVTVNSIAEARRAVKAGDFDLAVLDVALAKEVGADLLPELRDGKGNLIPVVVFSAKGANLAADTQVQTALVRSHTSIDSLVATVRDRLASRLTSVSREIV
jgi:signal transduction histidine kinase